MPPVTRSFQVFAKPGGWRCNLACAYCYYLPDGQRRPLQPAPAVMEPALLERYIVQHLAASADPVVNFSWHGGEPTVLGLDYFRRIVALQKKHLAPGRRAQNGIQTNGTLIDDQWGRFLAAEGFTVGLSLDGPAELHDAMRRDPAGRPSHARVLAGLEALLRHRVPVDLLCVVGAHNVERPREAYGFLRGLGVPHLSFLPLVEPLSGGGVSERSVPAAAWGDFLCAVFDQWQRTDIGRIKVQIFEEMSRVAFGQEHSLCLFRPTCGDIPVVEADGGFYPCDHFVAPEHRLGDIGQSTLAELLAHPRSRAFGRRKAELPGQCRRCEVLAMCQGECPRNRILTTSEGEPGLNHLCQGYRRFFNHALPFVRAVAAAWRAQGQAAPPPNAAKVGRNQPCPCGSGRKYKHCCLGQG